MKPLKKHIGFDKWHGIFYMGLCPVAQTRLDIPRPFIA